MSVLNLHTHWNGVLRPSWSSVSNIIIQTTHFNIYSGDRSCLLFPFATSGRLLNRTNNSLILQMCTLQIYNVPRPAHFTVIIIKGVTRRLTLINLVAQSVYLSLTQRWILQMLANWLVSYRTPSNLASYKEPNYLPLRLYLSKKYIYKEIRLMRNLNFSIQCFSWTILCFFEILMVTFEGCVLKLILIPYS